MSKILQYQEEVLNKLKNSPHLKNCDINPPPHACNCIQDFLISALSGQLKVVDEMIEDDKIKIDSKVKLPDDIKNRIIISNKALSNIQLLLQNK